MSLFSLSLPLFFPTSLPPPSHSLQDAFFYSLVYDPQQKTLLADKGEIRVGNKYQADITDFLKEGTYAKDTRTQNCGLLAFSIG